MSSLQMEEVTLQEIEELEKSLEKASTFEWTPQDEAIMERLYPLASQKRRVKDLAKLLGRSATAVQQKAARMGLSDK